ncbi:MAG: preprotein translocase subunit SecY [Lachnospiraceae bacterium]|nr:preprotein translocase subunit SecY [Lachnospiraceae bacterium]
MFKTLKNALKVKEIREKLLFTFLMMIVIRIGSQLPIPGIDAGYLAQFSASLKANDAYSFFGAFTGGSLEQMSVFALSITPYITSSIIMQLLTIAIPKLEELQKEGETGKKKIAEITRYVTVGLALVEGIAMSIGFGNMGVFGDSAIMGKAGMVEYIFTIARIVVTMTAGSAVLMWIGERITDKGVGNGISIILMINIVSRIPSDLVALYQTKVAAASSIGMSILAAAIIIVVLIAMIAFVVVLQAAYRKIPVQYAKKVQGRQMVGGNSSHIPLKVNTAGVIPVIFASSLMQFPVIISQVFGSHPGDGTVWGTILKVLSSNYWFVIDADRPIEFAYTGGFLIYAALLVAFAYFYTSLTFNPMEVANNMKKSGGFIPGIRPGKPTEEYLTKILNYIVFIGAIALLIVAGLPIFFSGAFQASVSFLGTSLIIVVGVVIETLNKLGSMMVVRNYKGFLD